MIARKLPERGRNSRPREVTTSRKSSFVATLTPYPAARRPIPSATNGSTSPRVPPVTSTRSMRALRETSSARRAPPLDGGPSRAPVEDAPRELTRARVPWKGEKARPRLRAVERGARRFDAPEHLSERFSCGVAPSERRQRLGAGVPGQRRPRGDLEGPREDGEGLVRLAQRLAG